MFPPHIADDLLAGYMKLCYECVVCPAHSVFKHILWLKPPCIFSLSCFELMKPEVLNWASLHRLTEFCCAIRSQGCARKEGGDPWVLDLQLKH